MCSDLGFWQSVETWHASEILCGQSRHILRVPGGLQHAFCAGHRGFRPIAPSLPSEPAAAGVRASVRLHFKGHAAVAERGGRARRGRGRSGAPPPHCPVTTVELRPLGRSAGGQPSRASRPRSRCGRRRARAASTAARGTSRHRPGCQEWARAASLAPAAAGQERSPRPPSGCGQQFCGRSPWAGRADLSRLQ